jgi:biotin carboxyl carrier protein
MRFLKWKYGLETPPEETKAKTLNDVKREEELIARLKAGKLAEREAAAKGSGVRTFKVYVGDEVYSVGVEAAEGAGAAPAAPAKPAAEAAGYEEVEEKAPPSAKKAGETQIIAPMPGIIIRYEVKVGDEVNADDTILILEAMKMANSITTPAAGKIKAINFASGDKVARDDVLAVIG